MWVHRVRRDKKNELLPAWQASALDGLGFEWKVHQQVAKWFFNLHEARRWKVRCFSSVHAISLLFGAFDKPSQLAF